MSESGKLRKWISSTMGRISCLSLTLWVCVEKSSYAGECPVGKEKDVEVCQELGRGTLERNISRRWVSYTLKAPFLSQNEFSGSIFSFAIHEPQAKFIQPTNIVSLYPVAVTELSSRIWGWMTEIQLREGRPITATYSHLCLNESYFLEDCRLV